MITRKFYSKHPIIFKLVKYGAVFLLSLLVISLLFRNQLISFYIGKKIESFNSKFNANLKVGNVHTGWTGSFLITDISLRPENGDTLLKTDTMLVSVNLWKLLRGRLVIRDMELGNIRLSLIRRDSIDNFLFILKKRMKNQMELSAIKANYSQTFNRLLSIIFDRIPRRLRVRTLNISGNTNGHEIFFHLDHFNVEHQSFVSVLQVKEDSVNSEWEMNGKIDPIGHIIALSLLSKDNRKIILPFLKYKWGATISMDTLSFSFHEQNPEGDLAKIDGVAALRGLIIDHSSIASKPVFFDKLAIRYLINIGNDYAELDSSTKIIFNTLNFHPYLRYRNQKSKQITIRIRKPDFPAEELFSSFPEGLFSTLSGLKVKGNLSFFFDFFVDLSTPDSLVFKMDLERHRFTVLSYGNTDLYKIDSSFLYTAYENDKAVQAFKVGPENPLFCTLNKISPYLRYAVLTSEDGGFYQHRGFLPDAFRASVIQDIKERRFARGGSTISMQLVKNVFLNRNKTVGRKVEEALLVWLLENQNITTKDRMFEVYLNVIEWGPLVYGANEAAHFYFNKEPSKLSLAESIFLASIIPRPKWFIYSFDETCHLRAFMADYYRLVSGKMLNKGWITKEDCDQLIPDVELKGPAKLLLLKRTSLPVDSTWIFEYPGEE